MVLAPEPNLCSDVRAAPAQNVWACVYCCKRYRSLGTGRNAPCAVSGQPTYLQGTGKYGDTREVAVHPHSPPFSQVFTGSLLQLGWGNSTIFTHFLLKLVFFSRKQHFPNLFSVCSPAALRRDKETLILSCRAPAGHACLVYTQTLHFQMPWNAISVQQQEETQYLQYKR